MTDFPAPELEIAPLRRPDPLLDLLVQLAAGDDERGEITMGVTVCLKGTIVAGQLCSYGEWVKAMKGTADNVKGLNGKELYDAVLTVFEENTPTPREDSEDAPYRPRQYFHMKNVSVSVGGVWQNSGSFRGLLGEVDGWTWGEPA